jgi:aconitase A
VKTQSKLIVANYLYNLGSLYREILGQMSVERHEIEPASGPLAFSHTLVGEADHHTTILNGLVCLGAVISGNDRFLTD